MLLRSLRLAINASLKTIFFMILGTRFFSEFLPRLLGNLRPCQYWIRMTDEYTKIKSDV